MKLATRLTLLALMIAALWWSAFRTPSDGNGDFAWGANAPLEVSVGWYGIHAYAHVASGDHGLGLFIWQPRILHTFVSKRTRDLMRDARMYAGQPAYDAEIENEFNSSFEADKAFDWQWPYPLSSDQQ